MIYQLYYAIEYDVICMSILQAIGWARTSTLGYWMGQDIFRAVSQCCVFDVTCKIISFLLLVAPGANHHMQTTLFVFFLLVDEKEQTFVWLFQNWLNCMWDKASGAIIID